MTKDQIQTELTNLEAQMKQLEQQANALSGAIAFAKHLIQLEEKNAPEAQQE